MDIFCRRVLPLQLSIVDRGINYLIGLKDVCNYVSTSLNRDYNWISFNETEQSCPREIISYKRKKPTDEIEIFTFESTNIDLIKDIAYKKVMEDRCTHSSNEVCKTDGIYSRKYIEQYEIPTVPVSVPIVLSISKNVNSTARTRNSSPVY